jgi:hypothetical protein
MSMQLRLPRPAVALRLKKWWGPIAAALVAALVLVPSAASGTYSDASGDAFGGAGDLSSVTVSGDKASGQLVFRITGTNIASSEQNALYLDIDTDANPLTGSLMDSGAEYEFYVDNNSYGFGHWDGSHWTRAPNTTVLVSGNTSAIMISVNRSELGNTADFNFVATAFNMNLSGGAVQIGLDTAPDDGAFNYSFDANGPEIDSVDLRTTPSTGPKAGKPFVIVPTGLKLPPDGRTKPAPILPESYSCAAATLGAKKLAGSGTGGCTIAVPKKKARGKKLTVQLTVVYQGATKVVPLTFTVT